ELSRLLGPAQRRERPQRRREPRIEHVLVAMQRHLAVRQLCEWIGRLARRPRLRIGPVPLNLLEIAHRLLEDAGTDAAHMHLDLPAVIGLRLLARLRFGRRDENLEPRVGLAELRIGIQSWPVPGRDLMAPPELARDAPRLDVLHPRK